jgi:hypothetical protein
MNRLIVLKVLKLKLTSVAFLLLALGLAGASPVQAATTYSGRAFAAFVNTAVTGPVYLSDTGELAPTGGFRADSLLSTQGTPVWGVLQAEVLVASTSGASGVADSSASLLNVVVLPGTSTQLTASLVRAETEATCAGVRGASEIADVIFGGMAVAVTGQPNQTVNIPNPLGGPPLATLIINEQTTGSSGTYSEIRVNALHLLVPGVAEVILSSAKSDINCQPPVPLGPCHDFVTGGGWIQSATSRANFGFNAGFHDGSTTPEVHLNYIDHATGKHVKAISIAIYKVGNTSTSRHFEGEAEVDGTPGYYYWVDVADNEPGGRLDTFSLQLNNGYGDQGTLQGGNIQLHKPCP